MQNKIIEEIISFPCLNCGRKIAQEYGFCKQCFQQFPFILAPACPGCGAENDGIFEICSKCLKETPRAWKRAVSLMRMEGAGQDLIHRLKYYNDTALARAMGEIAAEKIDKSSIDIDCIVPVPLHWMRRLTRGYNQAELLAQVISKNINIPHKNLLKRIKHTPRQANLARKQRLKNLDGAFSINKRKNCTNLKILLIDDVMTTGTTLNAASQVLVNAGATEVNVLSLLRA